MSKYDKSVSISHEEEGTYHRREYEQCPPQKNHSSTKYYTTTQVVPVRDSSRTIKHYGGDTSGDDDGGNNTEEWTTSKRKVNHKTRQVETRVSRKLLVEDGKVIADSGPQVTTRIKEDNKVEESEKEKVPKNKSKFDALSDAPECDKANGRVLGEKKEILKKTREVREENMQYHDERFKELTGRDVHSKAIKAPHELITITDREHDKNTPPRGKMVHYSNKGKIYHDTDEILEVAKMAKDGSITKEVKRTHHHEEESEDELPDEKGEADKLRRKPVELKSARRGVDYVNDFDDTAIPPESSGDEIEGDPQAIRRHTSSTGRSPRGRSYNNYNNEHDNSFPKYELEPVLHSLNIDDHDRHRSSSGHHKSSASSGRKLPLEHRDKSDSASSSDDEEERRRRQYNTNSAYDRSISPRSQTTQVEIPEIYRKNKEVLRNRNRSPAGSSSLLSGSRRGENRERSFSPSSKLSHRSAGKSTSSHHRQVHHHPHEMKHSSNQHHGHREDASVQAHLTDEDIERKSLSSSSSLGGNNKQHQRQSSKTQYEHEQQTRHLQRQSTTNSSRNYYFGEPKHQRNVNIRKQQHDTTSSGSSLSDPKEQMRRSGARSKDSGFRSPHNKNDQQQIYSVSSKSKNQHRDLVSGEGGIGRGRGAISPTPTTGSMGQRSVKTTTTTVSAGLADRPQSRAYSMREQEDDYRPIKPDRSSSKKRADRSGSRDKKIHRNVADSFVPQQSSRSVQTNTDDLSELEGDYVSELVKTRRSKQSLNKSYSNRGHQAGDEEEMEFSRHSLDNVSLSSSLLGPNATTIKVPYKRVIKYDNLVTIEAQEHEPIVAEDITTITTKDNTKMHRNSNVKEIPIEVVEVTGNDGWRKRRSSKKADGLEHFDYKTIIGELNSQPTEQFAQPSSKNVIDAYNVRVIQHNSPFLDNKQEPIKSVSDLSSSIARLEILSSELGSMKFNNNNDNNNNINNNNITDNNNDKNFELNNYVKHNAMPVLVTSDSGVANSSTTYLGDDDDDRASLMSSRCSLRSSRTYNITSQVSDEQQLDNDQDDDIDQVQIKDVTDEVRPVVESKMAAWIFDPRDNSTTAIVAPPKPKKPEPPEVETEELAEGKGGRSYYLELVDKKEPVNQETIIMKRNATIQNRLRPRPTSVDSCGSSRWSSQRDVSSVMRTPQRHPLTPTKDLSRQSRQMVPAKLLNATNHKALSTSSSSMAINVAKTDGDEKEKENRRQLPFSGPPVSNRSKSSSCLLSSINSTKPSKYSIYGGLRKENSGNKPVPRLSYSRAIGPKSQRQIDAQPKVPSRYLKMK